MNKDKYIFIRNDDVRGTLDHELIELTNICVKHQIPISHAVEPANITVEVVEWIKKVKMENPKLIEIIQHGFDHNLQNPYQKMEFGGNRTYLDQLESVEKGKMLMNSYFENLWSPVFTFPYGTYNSATLKAIQILGYKAISSKIDYSFKTQLKNKIGRIIESDFVFGKKVNYHPSIRKHYGFHEISVSANLIKEYTGVSEAIHYSVIEIQNQVQEAGRFTNIIGILMHHRFHTNHLNLIEDIIISLKEKKYQFSTIMNLVC